jgi:hypothetical protein
MERSPLATPCSTVCSNPVPLIISGSHQALGNFEGVPDLEQLNGFTSALNLH